MCIALSCAILNLKPVILIRKFIQLKGYEGDDMDCFLLVS